MLRRLRTATRDGVDLFPIPGTERKQAGPSAGSIEPPWRHVAPGRPRTDLHGGGVLAKMCALAVRMPPKSARSQTCPDAGTRVPKSLESGPKSGLKRPISPEIVAFCPDGAPEDATLRAKAGVSQRHICGIAH